MVKESRSACAASRATSQIASGQNRRSPSGTPNLRSLEKSPWLGAFTFDLDTGRMQISPGYAAIHGLPEGTRESWRADWRSRVHPDDLPRLEANLQRSIAERHHDHQCEYRIVLPAGDIRWIEARSLISYDTDGRAQRIVGTNIDVTERRRTEAAVKEGQTRLAAALAAGRVMAFEWDAATRLIHRSDNAIVVLGNDHAGSHRWPM